MFFLRETLNSIIASLVLPKAWIFKTTYLISSQQNSKYCIWKRWLNQLLNLVQHVINSIIICKKKKKKISFINLLTTKTVVPVFHLINHIHLNYLQCCMSRVWVVDGKLECWFICFLNGSLFIKRPGNHFGSIGYWAV